MPTSPGPSALPPSSSNPIRAALSTVDINSEVAVYEQIEQCLLSLVVSGVAKPGDQLPSVRELSETLKVNPNTVAKAYRDAEIMGLVYTRRGMGIYIQKGAASTDRAKGAAAKHAARLHESVALLQATGLTVDEIHQLVLASANSGVHPFGGLPVTMQAILAKRKKAA